MGHRGYVIEHSPEGPEPPTWCMWYTHWGALLRYDTPMDMKIPLPMSPSESEHRPTFGADENYVFLRTQWPTTYETSSEWVGTYDEDGSKDKPRRYWDSEKEVGEAMDYYEEAHWETTDETCPHCENREDRLQRTLRYCALKNLSTFLGSDYSNILLVYENGIYYVCWYDKDGGINRFERDKQRISKGEYSLIQSDPKKYDYLLYEFLPFHGMEALKYDCPVCRGSGRKYWNIGTLTWIAYEIDDDFPPVPPWRKAYEKLQGKQANSWYIRKDARIGRHDVLAHSYWGIAWRAQTRQGAAEFGDIWGEDQIEELTRHVNQQLLDFLKSADAIEEIDNGMGYQILNMGFNECAPEYYKTLIRGVSPTAILTIPKWSVYGASYSTTIFAINYPMGKNVLLDYRMPRNPLPTSFTTMWEKAKVELPGYFNI